MMENEELSSPNLGGLSRLREDSVPSSLSNAERQSSLTNSNSNVQFFPTESLYSFSFSPQTDIKSESRRGLLYRSLDFVKNKYGNKYVESIIHGIEQNSNTHWLSAATGHLVARENGMGRVITPIGEEYDDGPGASSLPPIRSVSSPNLSALGRQIASASSNKPPQAQQQRALMGVTGGAGVPMITRSAYMAPWQSSGSKLGTSPALTDANHVTDTASAMPFSIDTHRPMERVSFLPPSLPSAPLSIRAKSLNSPTRFLPPNKAMLTTDGGLKVLTANDQALFIFGTPQKELIGCSLLNLIAPSYREKFTKLLNKQPGRKDVVLVCGKVVSHWRKHGENHKETHHSHYCG